MEEEFKNFSTVREYFKKKFDLKLKIFKSHQMMTLEKTEYIKANLKKNFTLDQIGTLRTNIQAECEQKKSFSMIVAVSTIVITLLIAAVNISSGAMNRIFDKTDSIIKELQKETSTTAQELMNYNQTLMDRLLFEYHITQIFTYFLIFLGIYLLCSAYVFYIELRLLASINSVVEQSYVEKEKEEEARYKEELKQVESQEKEKRELLRIEQQERLDAFNRKKIRKSNN